MNTKGAFMKLGLKRFLFLLPFLAAAIVFLVLSAK
jgi:hypothetical protein